MTASGIFDLADLTVTTAGTQVSDPVVDLDGMGAVTAQIRFLYAADANDSPAVRAYLQTSLDQGTTWRDIACVLFAQATETAILNFSGLTPKLTAVSASDGALADDTAVDGILGDRLRLKIRSVGTYSGGTLVSARIAVR